MEDVHWNWFCVWHFSIDTHYNQFYVNTFEFSIWECLTMCRKHVSLSISIDEDTFPNKSIHSNWMEFILNVFIIDSWSAGFVIVVVVIIFLSFLLYSVLNKTTTVRLITSIRRYRERKIVVCHRKHKSLTPSFFSFALYLLQCMEKQNIIWEKKISYMMVDNVTLSHSAAAELHLTCAKCQTLIFQCVRNAMHVNKSSGEFIASLCQCDVACVPNGLARIFNI